MAQASTPRLGFIGLGTMGSRLARRLLQAGYALTVYDIDPAAVARLRESGAQPAPSVPALVAASDIVLSSLPLPTDVAAVYTGPEGALQTARPDQVMVDLSTIDPTTAQQVAQALAAKGVAFLDAPVSGGPVGAESGTLVVMVGGEAAALERVEPVLRTFSQRIVHVGPVGAGSTLKLANQLLVAAHTIATMEAVVFAERAGIPPQTVLAALSAGAADSVILRRSIRDFVLTGDFRPQFALRLLVKDLRLYLAEAWSLGTPTPTGEPALALFEQALAAGYGGEDYAAVLKLLRQMAETPGPPTEP